MQQANLLYDKIYRNVLDIDLYAGGVSETAVEGGVVGPTFACLIAYQFRDLKKGDRFWHENPPPIGSFTPGINWMNKIFLLVVLITEIFDYVVKQINFEQSKITIFVWKITANSHEQR